MGENFSRGGTLTGQRLMPVDSSVQRFRRHNVYNYGAAHDHTCGGYLLNGTVIF